MLRKGGSGFIWASSEGLAGREAPGQRRHQLARPRRRDPGQRGGNWLPGLSFGAQVPWIPEGRLSGR
ncbi:hypothetical protein E2C01_046850 [Portunus trituberculatus]|uniref:Uncharacterized protein n=1 Tax=Portunus trituberculatus TaxID=210409 RepID=A0A5B7G796_PORTR|nr:hypothetical protein [Portunus trituberculatus]